MFAPAPTPFRGDGGLDLEGLRGNLEWWAGGALAGLLVLGSNGEAPLLSESEADAVIRLARQVMPATRTLIAGTGRASTAATVEATRRAFDLGADAALVVPPHFYRSRMTDDALRRHYEEVAERGGGPVLLYHVPVYTGLEFPVSLVAELAAHPSVAGIKDSSGNVERMHDTTAAVPAGFAVLTGSAPALHPSVQAGAVGAIVAVACVAPAACCELFEAARAGAARAADLQRQLTPLARAVSTEHGVPGLKAVLDWMGLHGGAPRPPLLPLGSQAAAQLARTWRSFSGAVPV